MTVAWERTGVSVVVTLSRSCDGDHDALWQRLRDGAYGVASLDDDALSRSRVLSLPEAYYALTQDRILECPPPASIDAVWRDFGGASRSFVAQYVVYHHFRQLGWRVRSGLNYGAPFVLYREDADTFHSEYIVYVADEQDATPWHAVQARTRVAEDVKKTVALCEVNVDDALEAVEQRQEQSSQEGGDPRMETHARYHLHGVVYVVDAVLIRYWDPATVDEDRTSYALAPQPMLLKKKPSSKKTKSRDKRPRATG